MQLYHLWGKSRFVCAHIGQNRHIYPPSIFRIHFDSIPPTPFPQVDGGGCYREKFFLFFLVITRFYFFKLSTFRLAVIFYLCVILVWFPVEFNYLVYITISGVDYNFGFCVFSILYFDSFLLVEFYSHQFRLVSALQILHFDSLSL